MNGNCKQTNKQTNVHQPGFLCGLDTAHGDLASGFPWFVNKMICEGFTQFLNNSWWRCFYWHSSSSLCVSSLQTASMALSHKRCSSVDPFGLMAEIRLICLPASGTHLSRWPSNDTTECLRQAQKNPKGTRNEENRKWQSKLKWNKTSNFKATPWVFQRANSQKWKGCNQN